MASIKEVAERAGVSSATVSRVLTNKPYVSDDVRQRVENAARALNYRPDQAAQRLRAYNSSKVIGLLIAGIQDMHFNAIIHGVSEMAYDHQLNLILCNTDGSVKRQKFYIHLMQAERAAGLIINPRNGAKDAHVLDAVRQSGTAVILLDSTVEGPPFDVVQVDNQRGAASAVQHLLSLGRRRIAIITGRLEITTGKHRLDGYIQALREQEHEVVPDLIKVGEWTRASGYRLTRELLALEQPPDAIFTCNNGMTLGTMDALREANLHIPQDIALIGFDDSPWSSNLNPPLTTVAQPTYDMGREAVRLLMRRLAEPNAPTLNVTLETELIIRESCGARLLLTR